MRQSLLLTIIIICFAVATPAAGYIQAQAPVPAIKAPEQLSLANGKLTIEIPAAWSRVAPKSQLILHEFRAPDQREASARITISMAGGGVDSNIDRWITQFVNAKKSDAKIEKKQVAGQSIYVVDITGVFEEKAGGPFAPGPATRMENHRMLGAIIEIEKGDCVFIKIVGPKETVEKLSGDFKKSLDGLRAK